MRSSPRNSSSEGSGNLAYTIPWCTTYKSRRFDPSVQETSRPQRVTRHLSDVPVYLPCRDRTVSSDLRYRLGTQTRSVTRPRVFRLYRGRLPSAPPTSPEVPSPRRKAPDISSDLFLSSLDPDLPRRPSPPRPSPTDTGHPSTRHSYIPDVCTSSYPVLGGPRRSPERTTVGDVLRCKDLSVPSLSFTFPRVPPFVPRLHLLFSRLPSLR